MPLPPAAKRPFTSVHQEFAAFEEEYLGRYIGLADSKAVFVFGGAAALVGYLFTQAGARAGLLAPSWSPVFVLLTLSVLFLVGSALHAFGVVAPRLGTSHPKGMIFFHTVAAKTSAADYVQEVRALSDDEITEARLAHCFDLSVVCSRKYRTLRKAMLLLLPGVAAEACVLLLIP